MEEYEDNIPDENIQIISPKKCNFLLKDMNMFIKSERKNKYKNKEKDSEKLQTTIKEPKLFSNIINKEFNILKSNEAYSYQNNKIQNRKISEAQKFPEPKIVDINLNNLYKENKKLLKKNNKNITKNEKKNKIIHRNDYIRKVNYEQNNLTQRPKVHNINNLLKENKSSSLNNDFIDAHFIKNLKIQSAKNPKQILFEKKVLKKSLSHKKHNLDMPTKKISSKTKNISKKIMPKGIRAIKTQKKIKFIQTNNNNNNNRTFLNDYTNYKSDSKGSSVKLKKGLNMKLENNKKFFHYKEKKNNNNYNNSISVLINYKNLSKIKNTSKGKIFNINYSNNKNKKSTTFILGFKIIINIMRKKLKYFFIKLRKFSQKRITNINKEYRINSPIKNIFKKNLYIYGTNRKLHMNKIKNNCIHQSTKKEKKIKNINDEMKKVYYSSYKKNNGNNLLLLYPYSNINNFNINTIQINLFNDDLLYRISKNVNNKRLESDKSSLI